MNAIEERTDASLSEMKAEMRTEREEMTVSLETRIKGNNENFEVLRGTLVSRMDIDQARANAV
jgi:hypothetical protein